MDAGAYELSAGVSEQQTLDLLEFYKRYEGREVETRLDIGEKTSRFI